MDYYIPATYSVCILDKNTMKEHLLDFNTIYPYPDDGWFEDLEEFLTEIFGTEVDYDLLSFCLEL